MSEINLYCPRCKNDEVDTNKTHMFRGSAKIVEKISLNCSECDFLAEYSNSYKAT